MAQLLGVNYKMINSKVYISRKSILLQPQLTKCTKLAMGICRRIKNTQPYVVHRKKHFGASIVKVNGHDRFSCKNSLRYLLLSHNLYFTNSANQWITIYEQYRILCWQEAIFGFCFVSDRNGQKQAIFQKWHASENKFELASQKKNGR